MPELLMVHDAAERINLHHSQLSRARGKGLIPEVVKVGRYYLFPAAELDAIKQRLVASGQVRVGNQEVVSAC